MNSFQLPDGYGYATVFKPSAVLIVARIVVESKSNASPSIPLLPDFTHTL